MKYLSACLVIRNEAPYLKDWISFHLKQGVERIWIFDNESSDSPQKICKPFDKYIKWHSTKGLKQQRVAYNHVIREYRDETEWCLFTDADEFTYSAAIETQDTGFLGGALPDKKLTLAETIRDRYDSDGIAGIAVHWLLFGSNGHKEFSPEPVYKRFTRRAEEVNPHVKSIMRLSKTYSMNLDPHSFLAHETIVDEHFTPMPRDYAIYTPATADILRCNHYVTKSEQEYRERKLLPDANAGIIKTFEQMWEAHDRNDVEDKRILEVL